MKLEDMKRALASPVDALPRNEPEPEPEAVAKREKAGVAANGKTMYFGDRVEWRHSGSSAIVTVIGYWSKDEFNVKLDTGEVVRAWRAHLFVPK